MGSLERVVLSYDVIENKDSYVNLGDIFRLLGLESILMIRKYLLHFYWVQEGRKKGGPPKNEGRSYDVYENKGSEKKEFGGSYDMYENKRLIQEWRGANSLILLKINELI